MNILLVGSGGREHALAWKIAQSPRLTRLVCAPGNPGMAEVAELRPVAVDDVPRLTALAREIRADLVVIGPEASIAAGLADALAADGIACFGASRAAGRLESSKAFTKAFCARHDLPTAESVTCDTLEAGRAALVRFSPPYVVKADGLAAGKGVTVAPDLAAADQALAAIFEAPGGRVVLEAFMPGEEASLFALADGHRSMLFGAAQDHKRAFDGDIGPNTGGMGAYAPAPVLDSARTERARLQIVEPTVRGIAEEGAPYRGVLYAGLMIEGEQVRLVEFNARFGDPECQALMVRLEDDVVPYLEAAARGGLDGLSEPRWRPGVSICVVIAAKGYPAAPRAGGVISGLEQDFGPDVHVFHAGTARRADGALVAAGGRVLNVCALGATLAEARARAYAAVSKIDYADGFHRTDIGWRAL